MREHIQGWCAGSGSMSDVESGALNCAKGGGQLRSFLVPEPGRAWIGTLWPNRGAGFGPQRIAFWSSPHPSPRAYKRGSVEPLDSLRSLLGSSLALHLHLASSLCSLYRYWCVIARTHFFFFFFFFLFFFEPDPGNCRDILPCCRRSATPMQSDGPVWSARCHAPQQDNSAWDTTPYHEVGTLRRSIPRRYMLHTQTLHS